MGRCRPDKTHQAATSKQHELCSIADDTSNSEPLFPPSAFQMFKEGRIRNEICTLTYVVLITLGQFRGANLSPNSVSWNLGSKTVSISPHPQIFSFFLPTIFVCLFCVRYSEMTDDGEAK